MKFSRVIQFKALFLTVCFSLHAVLGFACSLGLNMGYNAQHHEPLMVVQQPEEHSCHAGNQVDDQPAKSGDDCCSNQINDFYFLDKDQPPNANVHLYVTGFTQISTLTLNINLPAVSYVKDVRLFARQYHPPISNVRILIQSFQI